MKLNLIVNQCINNPSTTSNNYEPNKEVTPTYRVSENVKLCLIPASTPGSIGHYQQQEGRHTRCYEKDNYCPLKENGFCNHLEIIIEKTNNDIM